MSRKSPLKHGVYARRMTADEVKAIGAIPVLNIDGEIAYQRVIVNRLGQIIENSGLAVDSTEALSSETRSTIKLVLDALGRLRTYLQLREALHSDQEEIQAEIARGKMVGRQRRHVFDYLKAPEGDRRNG